MALGRKRKSESASVADEAATPSKRVATEAASTPATPATGEKRGRGRPRKYPEGSRPAPREGPKRGRGRPPKDPAAKATPKPKTPTSSSRGRGRPKKTTAQANTTDITPKTKSSAANADKTNNSDGHSYWLMKAEPDSRMEKGVDVKFSIDDLRDAEEPEPWDGVRNPVAKKNMQLMKKGDLAFFYHSNCKIPGIAGIMEIVQEHSPDESAFDKGHPYYDEKSKRDNPKWVVVHVEFRRKFENLITLNELKSHANTKGPLMNLQMIKQGRLSVSAVTSEEWDFINSLVEEVDNNGPGDDSAKGNAAEEDAEEKLSE
ncbi:PUA-like domain-containing protein [Aspergillus pseudoustus]|uniref:PUA-like domain-containing protein n=1 Tax=Aspergillus pseudoustus TaxID=1810923 RepID=A0ABR4J6Y9_9EURO